VFRNGSAVAGSERSAFSPSRAVRGSGRRCSSARFASFWERGERRVALAVDAENDTGATRLYESVGMRVAFGAITYEKRLDG
jgi:hypothetical protein